MDLWFAGVLGVVQGLTEFLPVSSTAHLRIFPALAGQPDPGAAFSAVIQLGTLLAVLIYFARDLFVDMPRAILVDRKSAEARRAGLLILGTIPIVIAGLSLKGFITGDARSLYVVATALIVVGAAFFVAERVGSQTRSMKAITVTDASLIGLAQACALIPGVSRSGATILMALLLGLQRPDAARFSFLLGVPAIAGAGLFEIRDAAAELGAGAWGPLIVGAGAAAVTGYAAIAWLLQYLRQHSLRRFGVYRIALGLLLLSLCIGGVLAPG